MTVSTLPISRLIKVSVSLSPQAAQAQNLSSLLILGTSAVIDPVSRMRSYTTLAQVVADFGTSAPEYLAAVLWFEQNPQPTGALKIGRWVNAASTGQLVCAPLSATQQAIANFTTAGANTGFIVSLGSAAVAAPVIVASGTAVHTTATYTLAGSTDTFSGTLKLQVTGGVAFTVAIPSGTTLAAAVTLLNANVGFIANSLVASTVGATLVVTGAVGTGGSASLIDNGSTLVDALVQLVTGVDLHAVTTLNGVASAINGVLAGATCAWNAAYGQFIFTSTATGANAEVTFLTAPTGGATDISGLLGGLVSSSGAYIVPGQAAETALTAVTIFDTMFGQQWFAVTVIGAADSDHMVIAPYIEGSNNFHFYGITTQEAGVLVPNYTADIAYVLTLLAYSRTMVQFSSTNPYAVTSALARILTTDYTANNSVIDLMYKQEPGVTPEYLNNTQATAAEAKNATFFAAYNNNTAIIDQGNAMNGVPVALVIGSMAFAIQLQTDLYNALYTSTTKIPQSDAGMHILATVIENDATQFVNNGFLAPGYWTGTLFGTLTYNQWLAKGYYLYTPSVSTQSPASRAAGNSVPFQLAAKFSGNVRNVNLAVTVNQ